MKFHIKILFIIIVVFSSCSSKIEKGNKAKLSKNDSLLITTVNKYKKTIATEGVITLKFNKRSENELCFTLGYILNEFEVKDYKYYTYLEKNLVLIKDFKTDRKINGASYSKVNTVLLEKLSSSLCSYGYVINDGALYWCVLYKDNKMHIEETPLPFPGY